MTKIAFSCAQVSTDGQLPGVRGLRGHLLRTVTFLVYLLICTGQINLLIYQKYIKNQLRNLSFKGPLHCL